MMQKRKEDIENVLRNKADTLMKDRDVDIDYYFYYYTYHNIIQLQHTITIKLFTVHIDSKKILPPSIYVQIIFFPT